MFKNNRMISNLCDDGLDFVDGCTMLNTYVSFLLFAFSVRHSMGYWFRDIILIVIMLNHYIPTIFYLTSNPTFISPPTNHQLGKATTLWSSHYHFQSIKSSPFPIQQQVLLFKHEIILQHCFRSLFGTDCQRFCGTN